MKMITLTVALGCVALAACETTVQPGDNTAPEITVLDVSDRNAVVYTTESGKIPEPLACDNGAAPFAPVTPVDDNAYYLLPPNDDMGSFLFLFNDPSGIKTAEVLLEAIQFEVTDPDLPIVTIGADGREFYQWQFNETGTLRTGKAVTIDVTLKDTGLRPPLNAIGYAISDGAGNRTDGFFFLSSQDLAC